MGIPDDAPERAYLAGVADLADDGGDVDDAARLLLQHPLGRFLPSCVAQLRRHLSFCFRS